MFQTAECSKELATKLLVCPGSDNWFCMTVHICIHTHELTATTYCSLTTRLDASPNQRTKINLVDITTLVYQHTSYAFCFTFAISGGVLNYPQVFRITPIR